MTSTPSTEPAAPTSGADAPYEQLYRLAERQYAERTGELRDEVESYRKALESAQRGLIGMEVQRDRLREAICVAAGVDPDTTNVDTDYEALVADLARRAALAPTGDGVDGAVYPDLRDHISAAVHRVLPDHPNAAGDLYFALAGVVEDQVARIIDGGGA